MDLWPFTGKQGNRTFVQVVL